MLGKRGPQRGLFEADTAYGAFVGRDSFYGWLASQRGELFRDAAFAGLYVLDTGRPSVPPSLLATALVLQTYDGASDDEAKQRADYDLRWKVALGVELDARPFAKSTLQEFRAQLIVHAEQAAIFRTSLELAKWRGKFRTRGGDRRKLKVAFDTTNILGRGAVKDTYNLLGDGIVKLARVLAKLGGQPLATWAEAHGYGRYVGPTSLKGTAEIDWSDPEQRRRFLGEIVADADRLLEQARTARTSLEAGSAAEATLVEAAGLLSRVLQQDVERREDGPALQQGVAKDRLVSVHDPAMRHGRKSASKRFDGHKAAVVVDTDEPLITAVAVLAGNAPDAEGALELIEQTEATTGCQVEVSIGDCAYGSGQTRQAFAEAGRTLVAKVPSSANQGGFPKTAFVLDLKAGRATCPSGQTTRDFTPNPAGGGQFRFAAAVCAACPLRAQCVRGVGGRTVQVHPQERLLQQARALQASPAFPEYRRRRQVVEQRIARLVQLGLRQARHVGHAKTEFQLLMAAAVANLIYLAATSGQPTGADSAALGLVSVLLGLLVLLLSRTLGPGQPIGAPTALRRSGTTSPGPQPARLPTVLSRPGCRPRFYRCSGNVLEKSAVLLPGGGLPDYRTLSDGL
jgi:transposase